MGEKKGFFRRLVDGLTKTRDNIVSGMDSIFNGFTHIDEDFYEELEERGKRRAQRRHNEADHDIGAFKERHQRLDLFPVVLRKRLIEAEGYRRADAELRQ